MELKALNHKGPPQTGREMKKSAKFYEDLGYLKNVSIDQFFNFCKNIPYLDDPSIFEHSELVTRPYYTINAFKADCKKKAILIMAWCNAQNPVIPYILLATSEKPDKKLHHTFPIIKLRNMWLTCDPTYPKNFLGMEKPITHFEVI